MFEVIHEAIAKVALQENVPVDERIRLIDEIRKALPPESNRLTFRWTILGMAAVAIAPPIGFSAMLPFYPKIDTTLVSSILQISSTALGALAVYVTGRRSTSGTV